MNNKPTLAFVGTGNVACSMVPAFIEAGYPITGVASKHKTHARDFGQKFNLNWTTHVWELKAQIIIISVPDRTVREVAGQLNPELGTIVLHTTGSISMEAVQKQHSRCGVLYPLQTFSKQRRVNFARVPLCLEASSKEVMAEVKKLAASVSNQVYEINSPERKKLHVAAVFVCNFTNLMYTYGEDIANQHGLPFDILKPLITETAHKVLKEKPAEMQTGPAVRNDQNTITTHIQSLPAHLGEKYRLLSHWVQERFNTNK